MPANEAVAAAILAKWGHIIAGTLGVAVTLAYVHTMSLRQMVIAACSGMVSCVWGTPVAVAVIRHYITIDFEPATLDGLTGLTGFLLGMCGIYMTAAVLRLAEGFSRDPVGTFNQLTGRQCPAPVSKEGER
jgi:hypothetical protein